MEEILEVVFSVDDAVFCAVRAGALWEGRLDKPSQSTRSRFSVVFLGPRANAELVPKFHVALHASHLALPMVKSKFRPIVALQMLVQNFTIMQPFQRNTTIKSFTLCQIYLYQKDERALPGNLQTGDNVSCPPLNVVSLTTSPPHSLSLSLCSVWFSQ
jgi:hypothetical protein